MKVDPTFKKTFEGSKEEIVKYWQSISSWSDIGFAPIFGYDIVKLEIGKSYWSVTEGHIIHRKSENNYIFMHKDYSAFCEENDLTHKPLKRIKK